MSISDACLISSMLIARFPERLSMPNSKHNLGVHDGPGSQRRDYRQAGFGAAFQKTDVYYYMQNSQGASGWITEPVFQVSSLTVDPLPRGVFLSYNSDPHGKTMLFLSFGVTNIQPANLMLEEDSVRFIKIFFFFLPCPFSFLLLYYLTIRVHSDLQASLVDAS